MLCRIEKREAKSYLSCVCCCETVRKCEKYLQVVDAHSGKAIKGERYCLNCEPEARENNDIVDFDHNPAEPNGEAIREAYGAYHAAGATSSFFDDLNAGFIR